MRACRSVEDQLVLEFRDHVHGARSRCSCRVGATHAARLRAARPRARRDLVELAPRGRRGSARACAARRRRAGPRSRARRDCGTGCRPGSGPRTTRSRAPGRCRADRARAGSGRCGSARRESCRPFGCVSSSVLPGSCSHGSNIFGRNSGQRWMMRTNEKPRWWYALRDDVVEELGDPVDRLRDERHVLHAERHRQRVQRLEHASRAASCCS